MSVASGHRAGLGGDDHRRCDAEFAAMAGPRFPRQGAVCTTSACGL